MSYKLGWGSKTPGHIVYLIDLSESMLTENKIEKVMEALKNCLFSMAVSCRKSGSISESFTATIIGYNTDIVTLFPKNGGKGSVKEITSLIRESNVSGDSIFPWKKKEDIAYPRWQTYMTNAFTEAKKDIEKWIEEGKREGRKLPAPIVVNITDGQPEESNKTLEVCAKEALQAANQVKALSTDDGNVLLYNIHIGTSKNNKEILFRKPEKTGDPREDIRLEFLYESSSELPDEIVKRGIDFEINHGAHGFVSNIVDKDTIVKLIEFASLPSQVGETPKPQ